MNDPVTQYIQERTAQWKKYEEKHKKNESQKEKKLLNELNKEGDALEKIRKARQIQIARNKAEKQRHQMKNKIMSGLVEVDDRGKIIRKGGK